HDGAVDAAAVGFAAVNGLGLGTELCELAGFHGEECAPSGRTKTAAKLAGPPTIWAGCRVLEIARENARPVKHDKEETGLAPRALGGPDSRSQALVGRRAVGPAAPSGETLPDEVGNGTAVVINRFPAGHRTHLRDIDSTGTPAGAEEGSPVAPRVGL